MVTSCINLSMIKSDNITHKTAYFVRQNWCIIQHDMRTRNAGQTRSRSFKTDRSFMFVCLRGEVAQTSEAGCTGLKALETEGVVPSGLLPERDAVLDRCPILFSSCVHWQNWIPWFFGGVVAARLKHLFGCYPKLFSDLSNNRNTYALSWHSSVISCDTCVFHVLHLI